MKYRFTKSFKEGDVIDSDKIKFTETDSHRPEFNKFFVPDFLEEVKEPEYRYCDTGNVIKKNDRFHYIVGNGMVFGADWNMAFDPVDEEEMINMGNVFETEAGAEKQLAFLKARATLKRFMMEKNKVETEDIYTIWWNEDELFIQQLSCGWNNEFKFFDLEDAQECIELYTPELKIVSGVI